MASPVMRTDHDPDEHSDLKSLIAGVVADPDTWMDTPNDQLGGAKPRDFLGGDRERLLRELVRSIEVGMFT